eukprot:121927-Pleurochrysis_carterae.AAC.2
MDRGTRLQLCALQGEVSWLTNARERGLMPDERERETSPSLTMPSAFRRLHGSDCRRKEGRTGMYRVRLHGQAGIVNMGVEQKYTVKITRNGAKERRREGRRGCRQRSETSLARLLTWPDR